MMKKNMRYVPQKNEIGAKSAQHSSRDRLCSMPEFVVVVIEGYFFNSPRLPSQRVLQKIVENLRQGGGLEPMAIQFPGRHLTALSFNSPSYYLVRGWRIYH